jgi:hypothetical protein
MIGHYPPEEFEIFVDDAEEPARVVTAAEIAAMDGRIKAAMSAGTFADSFASNNEIDDGRRRRDVRADGEDSGQLVDKVLKHFDDALKMHCDAINKRMDAIEEKYMKRADKKRKDSHFDEGEEEEERERREKGEGDGDLTLKHEGRERDEDEPDKDKLDKERAREVVAKDDNESVSDAIALWRGRVDSVIAGFGQETPKSLSGEGVRAYQERVLRSLRKHSGRFKEVKLSSLPPVAFNAVMDQILSDAAEAAKRGPAVDGDAIVELKRRDSTGRMISTFHSNGRSFIRDFAPPRKHVRSFWPHGGSTAAAS